MSIESSMGVTINPDVCAICGCSHTTTAWMRQRISTLENQVELLEEDIECVHLYLDDAGSPRENEEGAYSIVGRIQIYGQKLYRQTPP